MNNNLTGIFISLLAGLDRNTVATLLNDNSRRMLSPASIRFRPGTKSLLDLMSAELGISLSELTNLIVEGTLKETFLPFSSSAGNIIERFEVLMQAHSLGLPDIAQLLSPWNIRLSVLQDRDRTMDYLTAGLLKELADWFNVSPQWLLGEQARPIDTGQPMQQWPLNEQEFNELIIYSEINENFETIFWHKENSPSTEYENKTGILIKQKKSINQVVYYPVISITPKWINNDQQQWINRAIASNHGTHHVRSVTISESAATALEQGTTLPVLIFNNSISR